jgi:hypothetical protein
LVPGVCVRLRSATAPYARALLIVVVRFTDGVLVSVPPLHAPLTPLVLAEAALPTPSTPE